MSNTIKGTIVFMSILIIVMLFVMLYSVLSINFLDDLSVRSSDILNDLVATSSVTEEDGNIDYNRVSGVLLQELADGGNVLVLLNTDEENILLRVSPSDTSVFFKLIPSYTKEFPNDGGYRIISVETIKNSSIKKVGITHIVKAVLEVRF